MIFTTFEDDENLISISIRKQNFLFLFGKLSSFIISLRLFYSTEGMLGMLVNKTSLFISPQELFTPTSNWSVKRFVLLQDRRVKIRKFCFVKCFSIWKFILENFEKSFLRNFYKTMKKFLWLPLRNSFYLFSFSPFPSPPPLNHRSHEFSYFARK